MTAREQWAHELASGQRTRWTFDALWEAACKETADEEFEQDIAVPQRKYLEELKARGKPKRPKRPAKWERDYELMTAAIDDGG